MKIVCNTDGKGLWNRTAKRVVITEITGEETEYGDIYLQAYFDQRTWNIAKHGLIYTDAKFLRELRRGLIEQGMSGAAAREVNYTEQGMQGDDYVSLQAGEKFVKEFHKLKSC